MKTIYFYFFLFYSKILSEDNPQITTTFAISAAQSFIITGIVNFTSIVFFCFNLNKWILLGIFGLIIFANYNYYIRHKKGIEIIRTKPRFFSNHNASMALTILFFLFSISFLIVFPIYEKDILNNCR